MNPRTLLVLALGMVAGIGVATFLMPNEVVVVPAPAPVNVAPPAVPAEPSEPAERGPALSQEDIQDLFDTDMAALPERPTTRPAERPELSEEEREQRIAEHQDRMVRVLQARIDTMGAERGWSEATATEIENIVLDIHDARIELFEASRQGEFSFGDMHKELGALHDEASDSLDELGGEGTYSELMGQVRRGMRPPAPRR